MSSWSGGKRFETTRWSLVARAGGDSTECRRALDELCRQYWEPLYAFLRARGVGVEDARDLVQGFFARLIEREGLARIDADGSGGSFRSFLLTGLKNHAADERDKARAARRGGGQPVFSLEDGEARAAERRFEAAAAGGPSPERLFLRRWAMIAIRRSLERLRSDQEARGRGEIFAALRGHLDPTAESRPYAERARELQLSEGAVKVAVHRLRARFRELFREEVAQTLDDPQAVDEEIGALLAAFGD